MGKQHVSETIMIKYLDISSYSQKKSTNTKICFKNKMINKISYFNEISDNKNFIFDMNYFFIISEQF